MKITHFLPGDQVDAISVAGEEFDQYELGPIRCEVFSYSSFYLIPLISSTQIGSGTLDTFLEELRKALSDKPIVFFNVINSRLRRHLVAKGFIIMEVKEAQEALDKISQS